MKEDGLVDRIRYHEHRPLFPLFKSKKKDLNRCRYCLRKIRANYKWYVWERVTSR